jgi:formate hydrogenlyase subunit 4
MNSALGFALAAFVYPGALAALVIAWALGWARAFARSTAERQPAPGPLSDVAAIRGLFSRETYAPEGVSLFALSLGGTIAVLAPLTALLLLPLPGNALVRAIGLQGDLIAELALLLGLPLARLFLGWIIPSPFSRLAADRGARLLAGVALPLVLGVTALAQVHGSLTLGAAAAAIGQSPFNLLAVGLGAIAFLCALPALAALTPLRSGDNAGELAAGEATDLSGHDLAFLRIGEALQLVACGGFFALAFVSPFITRITNSVAHGVALLVAAIVVALGLGVWEGRFGQRPEGEERPPLNWWVGAPTLIGLAALVAAAWATRGG